MCLWPPKLEPCHSRWWRYRSHQLLLKATTRCHSIAALDRLPWVLGWCSTGCRPKPIACPGQYRSLALVLPALCYLFQLDQAKAHYLEIEDQPIRCPRQLKPNLYLYGIATFRLPCQTLPCLLCQMLKHLHFAPQELLTLGWFHYLEEATRQPGQGWAVCCPCRLPSGRKNEIPLTKQKRNSKWFSS